LDRRLVKEILFTGDYRGKVSESLFRIAVSILKKENRFFPAPAPIKPFARWSRHEIDARALATLICFLEMRHISRTLEQREHLGKPRFARLLKEGNDRISDEGVNVVAIW
jgi:hypothetical protein